MLRIIFSYIVHIYKTLLHLVFGYNPDRKCIFCDKCETSHCFIFEKHFDNCCLKTSYFVCSQHFNDPITLEQILGKIK